MPNRLPRQAGRGQSPGARVSDVKNGCAVRYEEPNRAPTCLPVALGIYALAARGSGGGSGVLRWRRCKRGFPTTN